MDITPQHQRGGSGKLRTAALSVGVAAALFCEYLLASSRDLQQSAISGELLNGGNEVSQGGFTAFLFNYFGDVTYFLPLLIVFAVWQFTKGRFSLRQVDFFSVGIRLFGFNILLIGLCALMSSLFVAGATGAGGILGDFLNILFFSRFPRYAAPLIPILLTMAGFMMFFAHSPWWFCDRIGEFVMRILRLDKGDDEQKAQNEGGIDKTGETLKKPAIKEPELRLERRVSSKNKEPPRAYDGKGDYSVNFTGGVSPDDAPIGVESGVNKIKEQKKEELPHGRVEPNFGEQLSDSLTAKDATREESSYETRDPGAFLDKGRDLKDSYTRRAAAPDDALSGKNIPHRENDRGTSFENSSYGSQREQDENRGPSTIISRGEVNAAPGKTPSESQYAKERKPSPASSDDDRPDDKVMRTIITRSEPQDYMDGSDQEQQYSYTNVSDGPVYQAGAPGVKSETVGNPDGRGSVSTVITRGDSVTSMQFGQHIDGFNHDACQGGRYIERDSQASVMPDPGALIDDRAYNQDDGIISMEESGFTVTPYDEKSAPEDKANTVTAEKDGANSGKEDGLRSQEIPISEKDLDFASSFNGATRGVNGKVAADEVKAKEDQKASEPRGFGADTSGAADSQDASHAVYQNPDDEERAAFASAAADPQNREEDPLWEDDYHSRDENGSDPDADGNAGAVSAMTKSGDNGTADTENHATPEPPHADVHKFPTKDYLSSMITVPGNSEPEDNWRPPFSLLDSNDAQDSGASDAEARETGEAIDRCMREFGVDAKVVDYEPGPVITCFHILPGVGTRISKIANLQSDMCRVLGTPNLRVIDTIRGTQHIGLEVPNVHRKTISMREVVESDAFMRTKATLPLCLGENTVGEPVVADLATAPHLLIAGTTGSGKSIGINGMLLSLLLSRSPSEMRLILVDPKQVEFALYEGLPHLICPVISEPKETMAALEWCVAEMDRRYGILSAMRVRSLAEYNALIREQNAQGRLVYDPAWSADMGGSPSLMKPLPTIVMVIDEFADLMQAFDGRRNGKGGPSPDMLVQRIAQKARAAGIHLMLATQSPRSDVITGTLKSNLPSRIAYTVGSALDSRVILDATGAENLLGYGDLLASIQHLNRSQIFRAHGPFARNEEVEAVVDAWKQHCGEPQYVQGVTDYHDDDEDDSASERGDQGAMKRDELYDKVLAHVRDYQNENGGRIPSITSVQIAFGIGYPRTKKILSQMKQAGDI